MNILNYFESKTKGKLTNIGIGLGGEQTHNLKIVNAAQDFLEKNSANFYLFGRTEAISQILKESTIPKTNFELVESIEPEKDIIQYLKDNTINAIIRGNLSSSKFLNYLKHEINIPEINRVALLETFDGNQFFFGPVGIDECNTFQKKINFIEKAILLFKSLNIELRISVLSGGRLSDMGRDGYVDKTLDIAKSVVAYFKERYLKLNIEHDEILIENIIKNKSNLVIAPDGISGNLIYRTLVHLGGGKAYGAIYLDLDYPIIDTSRVGKISEIKGALILALALINMSNQ